MKKKTGKKFLDNLDVKRLIQGNMTLNKLIHSENGMSVFQIDLLLNIENTIQQIIHMRTNED